MQSQMLTIQPTAQELQSEQLHDAAQVEQVLASVTARPQGRLNSIAATVLMTVAIGLGAWFAAQLTWAVLAPTATPLRAPERTTSTAAVPDVRTDVSGIIAAQLFGQEPNQAAASKVLPVTQLALVLKGIIFTDIEADARAIIAASGKPQSAYRPGQPIGNDIVLLEIHRAHVILRNAGKREKLELTDANKRNAAQPTSPDQRIDHRADYQMAKVLGRVQTRLRTEPGSVMSMLRIMPVESGSEVIGIRIFPGPEPGLFDTFKLEPGDVLTAVNGIPLDSTARGLEVLRNLTGATEITLELTRGERRLSMAFSIAQ